MTKKIGLLALVAILGVFNYSIYEKQQVKNSDDEIILALAPVDPRSLMQGDYMRLNYEIAEQAKSKDAAKNGYLVIEKTEKNIAKFVNFYTGQALSKNQKLIKYTTTWRTTIKPNSFMFQEGKAKDFEEAKFALFKYQGQKNYVLDSLLNEAMLPIK